MNKSLFIILLMVLCSGGCSSQITTSESTVSTPATTENGTVSENTFYVSPTGDDGNPGTIMQPWSSIQHAADLMTAGDVLMVRGGIYNESIITKNSGNSTDGYITFNAFAGERSIINGSNVSSSQNGFIIVNDYIKLVGLEVEDWGENGIWIENSHNIEITDCKVHDVCYGIGMADGTHDFVIERVEIYNFDLYGFDASPAWGADNYNGTISDSVAHSARDRSQNVDGFALGHGNQHHFILNRCSAYDVFDGFDICSLDTTLNCCIAYDNWNCGFKLWNNIKLVNSIGYHNQNSNVELDWDGVPGSVTIQNCTFVGSEMFNIWVENREDQLNMFNSIVAGGKNIALAFEQQGTPNYQGDHNIIHNDNIERFIVIGYEREFSSIGVSTGEWTVYSGDDTHSIVLNGLDGLFKNLNQWDLHLNPGSIAIDNGDNLVFSETDFDGNRRPLGDGIDIGAYEYVN